MTQIFTFDTETTALAPLAYKQPPPTFVALGAKVDDGPVIIETDRERARNLVIGALTAGMTTVAHNSCFDFTVLGIIPEEGARTYDTMIADLLLRLAKNDCRTWRREGSPKFFQKLSDLAPWRSFEGKGSTQLSFRPGVPLTEEQERYLRNDVEATYELYRKQTARGVPGGTREINLHLRAQMALECLTRTGFNVDRAENRRQQAGLKRQLRDARAGLKEYGLYRPAYTGPKGGKYKATLSTTEMRALVEKWGEEEGVGLSKTKTGLTSIDHDCLQLFQAHPEAVAWQGYRDAEKLLKTYLQAWEQGGETIHPRYNPMVRSGRISCYGPNLTNVPSRNWRKQVKKVLIPPPGRVFFELDYGQLELCCLAYLLPSGQLRKMIDDGVDVHRYLGTLYFGKSAEEITKQERFLMKCANFGLPVGMGVEKFRRHVRSFGLEDPGVLATKKLIAAHRRAFPELRRYIQDDSGVPRNYQAVWSGDAEKWGISPEIEEMAWEEAGAALERLSQAKVSLPTKLREELERHEGSPALARWLVHRKVVVDGGRTRCPVSYTEAKNTRFQGLASNLTKVALARVVLECDRCLVHGFIHDSLLISVREYGNHKWSVGGVARIMLDAAHKWLPGVRVTVEAKGPGRSWFEVQELEDGEIFVI
jgi:DNA polymerase I-like protein with 3'-5' exonuclease and polymerase domains